jgi:hypothetical protein
VGILVYAGEVDLAASVIEEVEERLREALADVSRAALSA